MRKLLFISVVLFSFSMSFASQRIFIFHINGVNTTQTEALYNVDALDSVTGIKSNIVANNGHVDLLYNKTDDSSYCSLCKQLVDVFSQNYWNGYYVVVKISVNS